MNEREIQTPTQYRMPTAEELYALERAARLERSRRIGEMIAAAAKAIVRSVTNVVNVKEPRHA